MATIREYFDTDIRALSVHAEWSLHDANGVPRPAVIAKIALDLDGNAKYWWFFIPDGADARLYISSLLANPETDRCVLSPQGDSVLIDSGFADYSERASSATLVFTRRIFFYIGTLLSASERQSLTQLGAARGFHVIIRDQEYAAKRSELEKPLAFICHDTRDKDSLVRDLAKELSRLMCPVWYDEYSLKVGASLRASIEQGLKETRKCVVILSPHFFSNGGWGKAEFESIYTREILEKKSVMLPVWHGVQVAEVFAYSPRLADKVGLDSSLGVKELAKRLATAITEAKA